MSPEFGAPAEPTPQPVVTPTQYTVSLLPIDHIDAVTFSIKVEYRGGGRYGVYRNPHCCLGTDGEWSWGYCWRDGRQEPQGDDELDEYNAGRDSWLAAHRFDLDDALRLARQVAPTISVNGYIAADVAREIAREAQA